MVEPQPQQEITDTSGVGACGCVSTRRRVSEAFKSILQKSRIRYVA